MFSSGRESEVGQLGRQVGRQQHVPDVDVKNVFPSSSLTISGLYYKCFTIVIYDHNDSGQYYKTTITIVIDDPS